ncbi:MAG: hypothetical protein Q8O34_17705, partial [Rhodocyclaceae bacterium]|nr:hypothetical protein [Rhodocyclaceae bacterium]
MKTKFQWRLTPDPSALSAAAVTKTLLKAIFRYLAEVAASEAGELLSVRRKSHLLHAQMYARLDTQAAPQRTAPTTTEFS